MTIPFCENIKKGLLANLSRKPSPLAGQDIAVDGPFIVVQFASIIAGQLGHDYLEAILINVAILAAGKALFALGRKISRRG